MMCSYLNIQILTPKGFHLRLLYLEALLFLENQSVVELSSNVSAVGHHHAQFWYNLLFGLLEKHSVDESPAFAIVFQLHQGFENKSNREGSDR
jgi:hypothetical protein